MGGNVTNYNTLLPTAIATRGKEAILTPPTGATIALNTVSIENAAAASDIAWGYKLPDAVWGAGQWVNATTTFTDDTTDAQDAGTNDFALSTLTNNDGFIVYAQEKFNMVGFTVTTATSGGAPAYDYNYWNGSAWAVLTTKAVPGYTAADQWWIFLSPFDWGLTTASAGTGVPTGKYAVRLRATTAPLTTAPLASVMWVSRFVSYKTQAAQYAKLTTNLENTEMVLPGGASLTAYFATANAANFIEGMYRFIGVTP